MIRIALCDDDQKILDETSRCIMRYAQEKDQTNLEIVRFHSASALHFALDGDSFFDIFILDMYIGEEMGTDLAKAIRKRGSESPIIFLTVSIDHAPESFETDTLRYLMKPLNPQKMYEALDAALVRAEKIGEKLVSIKTENGIERINVNHVLYSESHAHYQHILLENGKQLRSRMTVSDLYGMIAEYGGFERVGSAYIINLRNIKNISTTELHLYNNISIPIPRGKHSAIKKAFWDYQYREKEDQ